MIPTTQFASIEAYSSRRFSQPWLRADEPATD
jgi:uncharacterized membrane protein YgcG